MTHLTGEALTARLAEMIGRLVANSEWAVIDEPMVTIIDAPNGRTKTLRVSMTVAAPPSGGAADCNCAPGECAATRLVGATLEDKVHIDMPGARPAKSVKVRPSGGEAVFEDSERAWTAAEIDKTNQRPSGGAAPPAGEVGEIRRGE